MVDFMHHKDRILITVAVTRNGVPAYDCAAGDALGQYAWRLRDAAVALANAMTEEGGRPERGVWDGDDPGLPKITLKIEGTGLALGGENMSENFRPYPDTPAEMTAEYGQEGWTWADATKK